MLVQTFVALWSTSRPPILESAMRAIFHFHRYKSWTYWTIFLTTEQSEVVPFFRAVQMEKRGRDDPLGSEAPLPMGREATLSILGVGLRSSVSAGKLALNFDGFG